MKKHWFKATVFVVFFAALAVFLARAEATNSYSCALAVTQGQDDDAPTLSTREVVYNYRQQVEKKSLELKKAISHGAIAGQPLEYDFVIVGGGPVAAMLAVKLKNDGFTGKILILEKTGSFGTFDRVQNFYSNSLDFGSRRGNVIAGSPLQPIDLDSQNDSVFRSGKAIGEATLMAMAYSGADIALDSEVLRIVRPDGDENSGSLRIELADGAYVKARRAILATGYRDARLPLDTVGAGIFASEQKLAEAENRSPRLIYGGDVLAMTARGLVNPLRIDEDSEVVIVGSGHAASTSLEALAGIAPVSEGIRPFLNKVTVVSGHRWQAVSLGERFMRFIRYRWSREAQINKVLQVDHLTGAVRSISTAANGRFLLQVESELGKSNVSASHVIFDTGYDEGSPALLSDMMAGGAKLQALVNSSGKLIAQKLVVNDVDTQLYVIGMGMAQPRREMIAEIASYGLFGSFLRLNGDRIKVFVKTLPDIKSGLVDLESGVQNEFQIENRVSAAKLRYSNESRLLVLKMELAKVLSKFRFPIKEGVLKLTLDGDKVRLLNVKLGDKSVQDLKKEFEANASLLGALGQPTSDETKLTLSVEVDGSAQLKIETLTLK